jgi:CHASE1-domain containing sensor protein
MSTRPRTSIAASGADYVGSLRLAERHTGISVLGYVEKVGKAGREEFLARTRADGAPDFSIHYHEGAADSVFDDLYPVKYTEPEDAGRRALGFDLGSHPVRRRAIERAMLSASFTLSDVFELDRSTTREPGFVFMFPVYHKGRDLSGPAARRAALRGLVSSPFPSRGLLRELPSPLRRRASFQIFNRTDDGELQLLTNTPELQTAGIAGMWTAPVERELPVGGQDLVAARAPHPRVSGRGQPHLPPGDPRAGGGAQSDLGRPLPLRRPGGAAEQTSAQRHRGAVGTRAESVRSRGLELGHHRPHRALERGDRKAVRNVRGGLRPSVREG